MKKIYLLALSTLMASFSAQAQTPCSTGRYASDTFTNVTVTYSVPYGSNIKFNGAAETLMMDIYQPTGDIETARPLIVLAHGGSFQGGTSGDADIVALCQAFTKKGYVCASINYRLGFFPLDSVNAIKAVLRGVQDMKASVRFFYKDKLTSNTYKIDTNNIFIGGSSAGAIAALHMEYLNKSCEINYYVTPTVLASLGGIEGYSGNQCYSRKVKGVINLCGALGRYGWLEAGDVPFASMHGTVDGTVKYNRGMVNPGVPLIVLDGSRMLKEQANALGINNPFYTWYGQNHVPYYNGSNTTAYMDTTIKFVRDFLISRLGCTDPALMPPNSTAQTATLYNYTVCTTHIQMTCASPGFVGIKDLTANEIISSAFPNPSDNEMTIEFSNANTTHYIELFDVTGKLITSEITEQSTFKIRKNNIVSGLYFLKVTSKNNESTTQKVIFN
ncbi:MAG: T9SS type A sorting domain-containing protein [Bacteroidota bacterium]